MHAVDAGAEAAAVLEGPGEGALIGIAELEGKLAQRLAMRPIDAGSTRSIQGCRELKFVDVAEALIQLQTSQVSLEASFSTIVRMGQLSLVNFL